MEGLLLAVEELEILYIDEVGLAWSEIIGQFKPVLGRFHRGSWVFYGCHRFGIRGLAVLWCKEELTCDVGNGHKGHENQ